jgi:Ca2+/Na+ antiporter
VYTPSSDRAYISKEKTEKICTLAESFRQTSALGWISVRTDLSFRALIYFIFCPLINAGDQLFSNFASSIASDLFIHIGVLFGRAFAQLIFFSFYICVVSGFLLTLEVVFLSDFSFQYPHKVFRKSWN